MNPSPVTSKHLLVGLPGTGKTTFIAALWHLVESGVLKDSLQLTRLSGDKTYLNAIRSRWLGCEAVPHTPLASAETISLDLVDPGTGLNTVVTFPDIAGETFQLQWKERLWSKRYDTLVTEASGTLLVIHPDHVIAPSRIDEATPLMAELGTLPEPAGEDVQDHPWNQALAPTQVQMVELLQFIGARVQTAPQHRVAVLVSAWDLVAEEEPTTAPETWLRKRLPLLWQFLRANPEAFSHVTYGISAQGGDFSGPRRPELLRETPWRRIQVVGGTGGHNPHDITEPVRWLMG